MSEKKQNSLFSVRTMAEIAIFAALGYVLDFLAGTYCKGIFPNGGSIGVALVCVFIISFRRGTLAGVIVGLIMGLLDIADGFYFIADSFAKVFAQVALDYWLAYPLAGLAGLFRKPLLNATTTSKRVLYVSLGCTVGGLAKLVSHYLSGILFWPGDPWGVGGSYIYSALYNMAYMLPCIILSGAIMVALVIKQPSLFILENTVRTYNYQESESK